VNPYDPDMTPDGTPPVPPRKRHHYIRWTLGAIGSLILFITFVSIAAGGGGKTPVSPPAPPAAATSSPAPQEASFTDPNGLSCAAADETSAGYCPGDDPSPTPAPVTKVTFVVTGWGNPSITYGSDSDNRDGGGTLGQLGDGNGLPWTRTMTFSGDAMYYSLSAQLEGAGDISCKIVVSGPGDAPLTVSHGHASGGYNICSAQAAPSDSTGTSWQNEG
jgi:hypothetical protein